MPVRTAVSGSWNVVLTWDWWQDDRSGCCEEASGLLRPRFPKLFNTWSLVLIEKATGASRVLIEYFTFSFFWRTISLVFESLKRSHTRKPLLIGVGLMIVQQWSGVNAVVRSCILFYCWHPNLTLFSVEDVSYDAVIWKRAKQCYHLPASLWRDCGQHSASYLHLSCITGTEASYTSLAFWLNFCFVPDDWECWSPLVPHVFVLWNGILFVSNGNLQHIFAFNWIQSALDGWLHHIFRAWGWTSSLAYWERGLNFLFSTRKLYLTWDWLRFFRLQFVHWPCRWPRLWTGFARSLWRCCSLAWPRCSVKAGSSSSTESSACLEPYSLGPVCLKLVERPWKRLKSISRINFAPERPLNYTFSTIPIDIDVNVVKA